LNSVTSARTSSEMNDPEVFPANAFSFLLLVLLCVVH